MLAKKNKLQMSSYDIDSTFLSNKRKGTIILSFKYRDTKKTLFY